LIFKEIKMKHKNILETIGNTPIVKINRLFNSSQNSVWIKLEKQNPGGSIKDRIALSMIEDAESKGILKAGMTIVEPTSGNTGIGLAMVAAVKGYEIILVMPESMSVERRKIMSAYGAKFELTKRELGMKGAIDKAEELRNSNSKFWIPQQFENEANVEIHRKTTALEIVKDFPEGIDYLITGVGTGGHISGVAEILKDNFPQLKVFAVEPIDSPVISGGNPGPHPIQGIGAGFIPKNLNTNILDGAISVSKDEAYEFTKQLASEEGIFAGISTGATLTAISKKIADVGEGKTILGFNYDTGERYLTVDGLF
jgi:cysteine synthase A